jgi:hypothetical protein
MKKTVYIALKRVLPEYNSLFQIYDDGLGLKCNIIADLTDAYFTREDHGKITQLLSNDTLQDLSNFFPDRDSCEGSWYYYVLGESHFKLRCHELFDW